MEKIGIETFLDRFRSLFRCLHSILDLVGYSKNKYSWVIAMNGVIRGIM